MELNQKKEFLYRKMSDSKTLPLCVETAVYNKKPVFCIYTVKEKML